MIKWHLILEQDLQCYPQIVSFVQSYWNEKFRFLIYSTKNLFLYCSKIIKSATAFLEAHHWKHCAKCKQNKLTLFLLTNDKLLERFGVFA